MSTLSRRPTLADLSSLLADELSGPEARLFTARARLGLLIQMVETKLSLLHESPGFDEAELYAQEGLQLCVREIRADLEATHEALTDFANHLYELAHPEDVGPSQPPARPVSEPTGVH